MHTAAVFRSVAAAVGALALTAGLSGCSEEPEPVPGPTPTSSPTTTETPWQAPNGADLTAEEQAQYEKALARWTEYTVRSEPFFAAGKMTPAAKKLFQDYWVPYALMVDRLETYESIGIQESGIATVLGSWPEKVTSKDGIVTVVIKECVDYSTITLTPRHKGSIAEPYVRTVTLDRTEERPFKVLSVADLSNTKKVQPCGG